ncbi:Secretory immunoglobulin A-binding protein EsiB, partial [Pseudolycoriella hygida]
HMPTGMCAEGHKYYHGNGVPQSYELAAQWFGRAAAEGNAEGYYNLALMLKSGKGVKLDVHESIRLFKLAASQDISVEVYGVKMPNIGVVEAEHSLGLSYHEGALEWYHRAIKHGSGTSANNIGTIYESGVGVKRDFKTALNYYKFASSLKVTPLTKKDFDIAEATTT